MWATWATEQVISGHGKRRWRKLKSKLSVECVDFEVYVGGAVRALKHRVEEHSFGILLSVRNMGIIRDKSMSI